MYSSWSFHTPMKFPAALTSSNSQIFFFAINGLTPVSYYQWDFILQSHLMSSLSRTMSRRYGSWPSRLLRLLLAVIGLGSPGAHFTCIPLKVSSSSLKVVHKWLKNGSCRAMSFQDRTQQLKLPHLRPPPVSGQLGWWSGCSAYCTLRQLRRQVWKLPWGPSSHPADWETQMHNCTMHRPSGLTPGALVQCL